MADLEEYGEAIMGSSGAAVDWPQGLANLERMSGRSAVRPLQSLGSPKYALRRLGEKLRVSVPNYKRKVRMFTAGYQALHECFPHDGLRWMQGGSAEARRYVPTFIEQKYAVKVHRFVGCMPLESEYSRRPRGHLGFHRMNLGIMLGARRNKAWRTDRYVEIYALLQSSAMVDESECLTCVTMCRQGKHRSVAWMCLEACLYAAMGFEVGYTNVCKWKQEMERCQWHSRSVAASGCPECGSVREQKYAQPPQGIADAVLIEFVDTVLALEDL